ncbi:MAG: PHP domain-containing protein [Oscillospiraceae bacterium]|nr:PHP domain-containing protein [Oscillospiraceae bacterium]
MTRIDLHVHTTASDGTLTPAAVTARARGLGLAAIAITDHDTVEGVAEAVRAGKELGVEVVPGIELSCYYQGREVHVLGYFIDIASASLAETIRAVTENRKARNHIIAERMAADGLPVSIDELKRRFPHTVIGRPHFAEVLVEHGLADSVSDAFVRYLNRGRPYFEPQKRMNMDEAAAAINAAGGLAVLAHPYQYRYSEAEMRRLFADFKSCGGTGIECFYSGYDAEKSAFLTSAAAELGMCVTGGSDFHGSVKPDIELGSGKGGLNVDRELLNKLKERIK